MNSIQATTTTAAAASMDASTPRNETINGKSFYLIFFCKLSTADVKKIFQLENNFFNRITCDIYE